MAPESVEGFRLSPQQRRLVRYGGLEGRVRATFAASGAVDEAALRASVDRVVGRHEALRTRFEWLRDATLPLQVIDEAAAGMSHVRVHGRDGAWQIELDAPALCLDAASCAALLEDFAADYAGRHDREDPSQYADVAEWLNEQLEAAEEPGRSHWAERLPAPGATPARATEWAVVLLSEAGDALRRAAEGVSAEALVLAAWAKVLDSLMLDGLIGVVRDGRRFPELEPVVGPLEAVAAIRPVDERSLVAAARALDRELEDATAYLESLPVDGPLPPAGFRWLPERRAVDGFRLERVEPFEPPFGIVLHARLEGPELRLEVGAGSDPGMVATRLARLLGAALAAPSAPLTRHPLLSAAEEDEAIRRLHPRAPRSEVATVLERVDAANPRAIAAIDGNQTLTYGELHDRSARVAGRLHALGARREEVVAVLGDSSLAWLVAVIGVWRAGCACLALDAGVPPARAAAQLAHVGARFAVGSGAHAPGLTSIEATTDHEPLLPPPPHPGQLACVTFTSGTTGRPKGVAVEHRQLAAYSAAVADVLAAPAGATFASPAAPVADLGMTAWLVALHQGTRVAILPAGARLDAERFAGVIEQAAVDILKLTPSHLEALIGAVGARALPRHTLVLGGERLPPELIARVRELAGDLRIVNHYGPTETTVGALVHPVGAAAPVANGDGPVPSGVLVPLVDQVPIGRALASARALPGGDGPVPAGSQVVELWVGGASVTRGYHGDPSATADRFRPDPRGDGTRAYRTGDLVRLDGDGAAVFAGRSDGQVQLRGTRIELGEVERELRAWPGVVGAVAAVTGEDLGRQLEAWVAGAELEVEPILAALRASLPEPMVPARLHVVGAIPRTPSGKHDRAALLDMRGGLRPPGRAPAGAVEEAVAAVLAELLGAPVEDATASFFDLGGNSLLATRALARLRDALALDIDLDTFFAASSVAELAAGADPAAGALLVEIAGMSDEEVARALERHEPR